MLNPGTQTSYAAALAVVRQHTEAGRFDDFLALCRQVTESLPGDLNTQLDLGALLSNFGFLSQHRKAQ